MPVLHGQSGAHHLSGQIEALEMHGEDRATLVEGYSSQYTVIPSGCINRLTN